MTINASTHTKTDHLGPDSLKTVIGHGVFEMGLVGHDTRASNFTAGVRKCDEFNPGI